MVFLYCFSLTFVDYKMRIRCRKQRRLLRQSLRLPLPPAAAWVWAWRRSGSTFQRRRRRLVQDIRLLHQWRRIPQCKHTPSIYREGRRIRQAVQSVRRPEVPLLALLERARRRTVHCTEGAVRKVST